mgnify:CR=1 FL=1
MTVYPHFMELIHVKHVRFVTLCIACFVLIIIDFLALRPREREQVSALPGLDVRISRRSACFYLSAFDCETADSAFDVSRETLKVWFSFYQDSSCDIYKTLTFENQGL